MGVDVVAVLFFSTRINLCIKNDFGNAMARLPSIVPERPPPCIGSRWSAAVGRWHYPVERESSRSSFTSCYIEPHGCRRPASPRPLTFSVIIPANTSSIAVIRPYSRKVSRPMTRHLASRHGLPRRTHESERQAAISAPQTKALHRWSAETVDGLPSHPRSASAHHAARSRAEKRCT